MNLHFYFSSAAALTQAVMFKCSETHSALPGCCWDVVVCFFPWFGFFCAQNFSRKITAGITTTVETEQLKIEIEKKTTGTAVEISLSLHHDVGALMDIVPHVLEVCRNPAIYCSVFSALICLSFWNGTLILNLCFGAFIHVIPKAAL